MFGMKFEGKKRKRERTHNDDIQTPMWLIDEMIDMINGTPMRIIDPCCGLDNRILNRMREKGFGNYFTRTGYEIKDGYDFFKVKKPNNKFNLAIYNPPFSKNGCYRFLKHLVRDWMEPDGQIICISPLHSILMGEEVKKFFNRYSHRMMIIPKNTFAPKVPTIHGCILDFRMVKREEREDRGFGFVYEKDNQIGLL